MADLESVITAAVADASGDDGAGETGGDAGADDGGTADAGDGTADAGGGNTDGGDAAADSTADGDESGVGDAAVISDAAAAAAAGGDGTVKPAVEQTPEQKALQADLDALGLRAPKPGERENRLPHSRVQKLVEKALIRGRETATAAVNERLTKAEARAAEADNLDRLIDQPEKLITLLAGVNPAYQRFAAVLGTPAGAAKPAEKAETVGDTAPPPDIKYPDGSLGYSEAQLAKRDDWLVSKGVAKATAAFEARFGKIEKDYTTSQALQARMPAVRAALAEQREIWGDLFTKEEALGENSAIIKYQAAHPGVPFAVAVSRVLTPRLKQSRDAQRADILKELEERGAAVKGAPKVPVKKVVAAAGPRSMEEVIAASLREAGLK